MEKRKKKALKIEEMRQLKGGTGSIWSVDARFRLDRETERHPVITNEIWTSHIG